MARPILPGSKLAEIWGSLRRYPAVQVLAWSPIPPENSLSNVVTGQAGAPLDLTPFLESIDYTENIGFENGDDPSVPQAEFRFRRNPQAGAFRMGWVADGVIVQILQGDRRVEPNEWLPIFTGTFRGRPGDNPGTRADESEGFAATAYGREERFLNLDITTEAFPGPVDVGHIAYTIAWKHMGLGQDEILFGNQGFESQHLTNQLVEINALQALYECLFPVGKKPKFDGSGKLVSVDVNLDKPSSRIYSAGNLMVERRIANPNDVEVNNQVVLKGLSHILTKVIQEPQVLVSANRTAGFFESNVSDSVYYSDDHSQRALDTYVVTKKKIKFSSMEWEEVDEFHGRLKIDTHQLRNARVIIFTTWLATQLAVTTLDLLIQSGVNGNTVIVTPSGPTTIAIWRSILNIISQVAMAGLLWAMQFIGTGVYEVWGKPFEYVYQELVSDNRLTGLDAEELRKAEFRNDFVSTIEALDELGEQHLRREMLKNQLYQVEVLDDPLLEVDDVIELADGARYYVVSAAKKIQRGGKAGMTLTCWKIHHNVVVPSAEQLVRTGYGYNYAEMYGVGL